MSFHRFDLGLNTIVTNECGVPIDPSKIDDNDSLLASLKIGDKVKWTSSRCVSGEYGLSCCGGQGRVFDITNKHVYVCNISVIISTISGFRKSSLTSLGFVHIDDFEIDQKDIDTYGKVCDQFNDPWLREYEKYELKSQNTLLYKNYPGEHPDSYEYIDSGDKYDYFLLRDMYGKPCMVELFEKSKRPSNYHLTEMTCFDL